jgi:hypothetical protein
LGRCPAIPHSRSGSDLWHYRHTPIARYGHPGQAYCISLALAERLCRTLRKMHQNLWWAVGYNVIAFPLAAGVFYPFLLSPEIAALAMSGSSALVAINALMLKRTKLAGITRRSMEQPALRAVEATA